MSLIHCNQNKFVRASKEIEHNLKQNFTFFIDSYIDDTDDKYTFPTLDLYNSRNQEFIGKIRILPKKAFGKFNSIGYHVKCVNIKEFRQEFDKLIDQIETAIALQVYMGYTIYI